MNCAQRVLPPIAEVRVRFARLPFVAKRLVLDAVVEKKVVVVADVPVAFVNENCWNEEISVVEVAVKLRATTSPTTERRAYGEVVPMPRFPF